MDKKFWAILISIWILCIIGTIFVITGLTYGAEREIGLSTNLRDGNEKSLSTQIGGRFLDNNGEQTLELGGEYSYDEQERDKTGERLKLYGNYRYDTETMVYLGFDNSFEYDYALGLERRIEAGPNIGIYKNFKIGRINFDIGADYLVEKYILEELQDNLACRGRQSFLGKISDNIEFVEEIKFLSYIDDLDNYRILGKLEGRNKLSERLYLVLRFEDEYSNVVNPGLKKNDLRYSLGITYKW